MLRFLPRNSAQPSPAVLAALKPYGGVMARLLAARGIAGSREAEAFLCPDPSHLHDPMALHGMGKALEILREAREKGIFTVVYGDYDVDGICANALLCDALRRFGLSVRPHVPLREEGYGLNKEAVANLSKEAGLLVTVDLGITNAQEVALAKELGMKVIVTDHHQLGLTPCPADAVVSPLLGDYPCPKLCGTGVAFKLAQGLLGFEGAREYLDLAALATVADLVPLTGENRTLVALGLPRIAQGQRPGMAALLKVSGSGPEVDSETLGFQLGPRLNAAGRLGDAMRGVRLMMTREEGEAREIAQELDALNTRRRQMEGEVLEQVLAQAAAHDFVAEPMLLAQGEGWHPGVVGLAAGRVCNRYGCPSGVFTLQEGMLHGSLRSIPGVNIHKCLQTCDALLARYGGHEQAAGCTLPLEHYGEFCARMQRAVRDAAPQEAFVPRQEYDELLPLGEASLELLRELEALAPFGLGNPSPLFLGEGLRLERRRACGAQGAHLQITLRDGEKVLDGIAFGMGQEAASLPQRVDVVYRIARNTFRGVTSLQCEAKAFRPAQSARQEAVAAAPQEDFAMALVDALLEAEDLGGTQGPQAGKEPMDREKNRVTQEGILSWEPWDESPWTAPLRGSLYVARTRESAAKLVSTPEEGAAARPELDLRWRAAQDPLCFPTALALPVLGQMEGHWRQVWLLDGEMVSGEAGWWRQRLPKAQVHAGPPSHALRLLAASLDAGDEAYRGLYRQLRSHAFATLAQAAQASGMTPPQARVGLKAFHQLGLIRYAESPFAYTLCPAARCSLGESPLLAAIRSLSA
ncbi:MAG: single-stranded-DNA-specific exonuclease RecJ [Candidatus Limiplasma sp.]|nr:single-stranded-DNA-specific exonuclease RecJ [Candidatus Limiplasma sp.]